MSSNSELRTLGMKEWFAKADVALAKIWNRVKHTESKRPSLKKLVRKFSLEPPTINDSRKLHLGSVPHIATTQPKSNKPKYSSHCTDYDLNHAKRRIQLAYDFDEMLQHGFPTANSPLHEYTLYISLTPRIAQPIH